MTTQNPIANPLTDTLTLPSGAGIPLLGLGTWLIDDAATAPAVRSAIEIGYRHIDTAQAYGNEAGVGRGVHAAIADGLVAREDVFVTTKVGAQHKDHDSAAASIEESLRLLDLGWIDLLLIHAPQPWGQWRGEERFFAENKEVWRAMTEAVEAGTVKAIGVSNFLEDDLDSLMDGAEIAPAVNQVLAHVTNVPEALIAHCRERGVTVEAYYPIAHGEVLHRPELVEMASRYGVTVPQLCLRFDLQLGLVVLPKTANPEHMRSNAELDFVISEADMAALSGLSPIEDYGDSSFFPVFSGKTQA